ncbi:MAG: DNA recombination protein RmuC [Glaciecola sp.]|jgi:DNA recombination protein RmuC
MLILISILSLTVGFIIGALLIKNKSNASFSELEKELSSIQAVAKEKELRVVKLNEEIASLKESSQLAFDNKQSVELEFASLASKYESLQEKLVEQKENLKELQTSFKQEFKILASDALKEQSKDFKEKNENMLQPFREQIKSFQDTVKSQIEQNIARSASFKEQIQGLQDMNIKISQEAHNLTKALKGDNKQQGNWGELILEKVLESSDLVKGQEYESQVNDNNDDDKRIQPDVVVFLPDEKHIIIDSKVSLTAYEKYVNSEKNEDQEDALKEHLASFKSHIKGLSEKKYQSAQRLNSPDFILMFIPIESSFGIAIREDISLFNYAWDRKVVMVSPSTLLATLKTVASIWKQEKQNKNVLLIAEESGKLYDKFVGFLEDLESIETNFKRVHNQLDDAKKKLSTGRGNIIGKVEKLRELGAKTNKQINTKYLDDK